MLLKPLPFPEPERIVRVWEAPRPGVVNATKAPEFVNWKRSAAVFEALSAEQPLLTTLTGKGEPRRLSGKAVTADYFKVFVTGAKLGRTFAPDEDRPGSPSVMVLSYAAWQYYFGGDPDILHRRAILDGESHEIIGVLAPGAFDRDRTQFWKPLVFTPAQLLSETHWLSVYGRLRDDATLLQSRDRMRAIHAALLETVPVNEREGTIEVEPLARLLVGTNLQRSISVAFGAVALVLLISCANVAGLLLAQGATRRTELSVRAALGAGRGRLIAQLLTESFVLCISGGVAGVGLAYLLIRLARPFLSQSLPFTANVTLDLRVLAFGAAVALCVALLAGVLPALQTSFGNLADGLKQSTRAHSGTNSAIRRMIVVGEVALSLVLVCGAVLLVRSLLKLQSLDTGVRIENVITTSLDLPVSGYPTPQKAALFYQAAAEKVRSAPGVAQAGLATQLPLQWIENGEAMQVAGLDKFVRVRFKRVDAGYFTTLGIPILAGRGITESDRNGSPRVIVINEALAARLAETAGMKEPIGKVVRVSCPDYIEKKMVMPEIQIVGIIRSERVASPGFPDPPVVYVPLAQVPSAQVKLIFRTQIDPSTIMPAVREAVRGIDPDLPLGDVATMSQVRDRTLSSATQPAWVFGTFAAVAGILAAIGLYGVVAHAVAQKRREIGIRMALGARSIDVLSHVLRNALGMVAVGLVFGLLGAFAVTRVIRSLLYEVSPLDPLAICIACLAMMLIGLLAGFLPANRAARVDPVTTLRDAG